VDFLCNECSNLNLRCSSCAVLNISVLRDSESESNEVSSSSNELRVKRVMSIIVNWVGCSLRTGPEWLSFLVFGIIGENGLKVLDRVVEVLVKVSSCNVNALIEVS
jgi:hypothetical protein